MDKLIRVSEKTRALIEAEQLPRESYSNTIARLIKELLYYRTIFPAGPELSIMQARRKGD